MEKEDGEKDTGNVKSEGEGEDEFMEHELITNSKIKPNHPGHINDCADGNIDPSEPPTKCN